MSSAGDWGDRHTGSGQVLRRQFTPALKDHHFRLVVDVILPTDQWWANPNCDWDLNRELDTFWKWFDSLKIRFGNWRLGFDWIRYFLPFDLRPWVVQNIANYDMPVRPTNFNLDNFGRSLTKLLHWFVCLFISANLVCPKVYVKCRGQSPVVSCIREA